MDQTIPAPNDTKKIFMKKGSCSQALCFLVNREFGHNRPEHEKALDPFAGGLLLNGHQCGMVWGSTMAAGIQAHREHGENDRAIAAAISASRDLVKSYTSRNGSANCRDVCGHDFTKKVDLFAFMVKFLLHLNRSCLEVADAWTPEACRTARNTLSRPTANSLPPMSCATVLATTLGATREEAVMVAGFAGGVGLSGNACGALGVAVWLRSKAYLKDHPGKSSYNNPYARKVLKDFLTATGGKILCRDLCGRTFTSIDEHSAFVASGGCKDAIAILSRAPSS